MEIKFLGNKELADRKFKILSAHSRRYYDDDGMQTKEEKIDIPELASLSGLIEEAIGRIKQLAMNDKFYADLTYSDTCEVQLDEEYIDISIGYQNETYGTDIQVSYHVDWE